MRSLDAAAYLKAQRVKLIQRILAAAVLCLGFSGSHALAQTASCTGVCPTPFKITDPNGSATFYAYGVQNAASVYFAVWTEANGQDDLVFHYANNNGGGNWFRSVPLSYHQGYGKINVHTWLYDANGQPSAFCGSTYFWRVYSGPASCSGVAPEVRDPVHVSIPTIGHSALGVQNATDVRFATWSEVNGLDDLYWYTGSNIGGGQWNGTIVLGNHRPGNPDLGLFVIDTWMFNGPDPFFCGQAWFTRVTNPVPDPGPISCASAQGTWIDDIGATWYLTQDDQRIIRGQVTNVWRGQQPPFGCPSVTWQILNGRKHDGSFFTATASSPSPATTPPGCPTPQTWVDYSGNIVGLGCNSGAGTWSNSSGAQGPWNWFKQCEWPQSESSRFDRWNEAEGFPTQGLFYGTLFGNNFGGRRVRESDPGGGQDGCYFTGSRVQPLTSVTGGEWNVQSDSTYGPDYIGFPPHIVAYYRYQNAKLGRGSCTVSNPQQMNIRCGIGDQGYVPYGLTNQLQITIAPSPVPTSVTVSRANASASR
ncbi:MAG: GBS Bsp-like repeat-containing protein [Bryobacteraceae bacterium]